MTTQKTTINQLADFIAETRFEDLPPAVVSETKRLFLDAVGCAMAGVSSDKGKWGLTFANQFMTGPSQSTVIGFGDKISALGAAFVNGELINAIDWIPVSSLGHISPFVIPAPLAIAEMKQSSGKDLITSLALAHEISERVGKGLSHVRDVVNGKMLGFAAVTGYSASIFGGAAAVCKLEGFSRDRIAQGLGMAGHIAPMQAQGSWAKSALSSTAKYLLAGWISQAEITAAYLIKAGHRGDVAILDGDAGFWRYAGSTKWEPEAVLRAIGQEWVFTSSAFYKPYPVCRITHTALDCLSSVMQKNDLHAEEIDSIQAFVRADCEQPVWINRKIENQVDAQFSMAYALSVMAHGIKPGIRWHDPDTMSNPEILKFMDKITVQGHPEYAAALARDSRSRMGKVIVSARGKTFSEERQYPKGNPSPIQSTYTTDEELTEKFKDNAARVLSPKKAAEAASKLRELENVPDVRQIIDLLHK